MIARTARHATLALSLLLGLPAWAETARPLLIEGTQTLYQRVLTRPGAPLHAAAGGAVLRAYPAFQPLYVFARQDGWAQVGPAARSAPEGWVQLSDVVEWKQNIIAAFTNPAGREPSLMFATPEKLRFLMEHEAMADLQPRLIEKARHGGLTPEDGVATGVGIEMAIDNELATFDTYTPTETLAYANQTMDIPVKLNYLQVADEVTPGPANAVATITLAYK